jgi:hypothetical protein
MGVGRQYPHYNGYQRPGKCGCTGLGMDEGRIGCLGRWHHSHFTDPFGLRKALPLAIWAFDGRRTKGYRRILLGGL